MFFVLAALTFVLHPCPAYALGFGKANVTDTVGFVREDNQRDTISLLLSCFATLGLCVYSAVHLNVPRKGDSNLRVLIRECKWCVIGLFAPELILYTAWRQLASARQLCHKINKGREIENDEQTSVDKTFKKREVVNRKHIVAEQWTLAHGFYGSMGGFAIDIEPMENDLASLFGDHKRLTLTAQGLALLAECGHVPQISAAEIKDKNKADGLAKLLVCIQAGWMIIQVTSRAATGLATTLLEVHVVAHVVCALVMYVIWWHKPRQVESPTLLKDDLGPLAMYMFLASRMSGQTPTGRRGSLRTPVPELHTLAYVAGSISSLGGEGVTQGTKGCFRLRGNDYEPASPGAAGDAKWKQQQLAAQAVSVYPNLQARFKTSQQEATSPHSTCLDPWLDEFVQPYAPDWPNAGLLRRTQSLIMGMTLWGASMAYGAIHVAAWDYFFPSSLEQMFWHLSSVWVTFCAAFWLLTNMLAHVFPVIDRVWVSYNEPSCPGEAVLLGPEKPAKKSLAFHLTFTAILINLFLYALDATTLAVATPAIASDLDGTSLESFWASISYLLAVAMTQPLYATLSDVLGRKHCIDAAYAFFFAGSIVFALAENMGAVIAGRVLQGLGGGGLDVLSEIIVTDMTTLQESPMYLGLMAIPTALGSVLGPTIGAA
ncbi:hypothetical protein E8E13_000096 [Curvularia kusanoi]|uniref:Major facilitator superfamily (MFS) profile domain-containing protein n=1 Tax=Curvularia kusanoi TaxID=90978 RepID=A0A9P4THN8_CURKU|nr:hypothetical protein E8E13_000096 [Curvularia kusanoi]